MKRILSLNLALILLFSLMCFSTPAAFATDAPQLIVDGVSYDYTKDQSGNGWVYIYAENMPYAELTLTNYNGAAISVPCNLRLEIAGTNKITAADSAGITVTGNLQTDSKPGFASNICDTLSVTGASGYPAIKATGTITIVYSIEAQGGGMPAFSANGLTFYTPLYDTFIGSSPADCAKGTYTDQYYFKRAKIPLSLTLYGNGGQAEGDQNSVKTDITVASATSLSLSPYTNTFVKPNSTLLGWSENSDGTGTCLDTDSVYRFVSPVFEASLYAFWDDELNKGVVLKDYCDNNCNVHDKVIRCTTGSKYSLPIAKKPKCTFDGWLSADNKLYPAGTLVNINETVTFTAKYTPLKIVIDGQEYDASIQNGSIAMGWIYRPDSYYNGNAYLDIYDNFCGSYIDVPCNVYLHLCKSLTGAEGKPAIHVNGNATIVAFPGKDNPVVLQGGAGSAAVVATGNIVIGNSMCSLIISSGSENSAALSAGGKVDYYNVSLYAGTNQSNAISVEKYSGEKYLLITDPSSCIIKGMTTVPEAPERDNYTFVGWVSRFAPKNSTTIWYKPGDKVDAGDGLILYPLYLTKENRATVAVLVDGNGGTTYSGSKFIVIFASSNHLSSYQLPTSEFSQSGYTLSGYNSNSAGTGTSYSKGDSITDDHKTLIYTVYTQWTQDPPSGGGGAGGGGGGGSASEPPQDPPSGGGGAGGGGGGGSASEPPKATSSTAEVKASAEGSTSAAKVTAESMNSAIDYALEQAKKDSSNANVTLSVEAPKDTKKVNVGIPTESIKKLGDAKTDASLTVTTPIGSITFDNRAVETIEANAKGADTNISIAKVEKGTLTAEQQVLVGDRPIFDFTIESNGKSISDFGGVATVSVPYTPAQGEDTSSLVVWYLADDGTLSAMPCTYTNGTLTFTTTHFSKYVLASVPFKDINASDWFYKSVAYACGKGLMKGTATDKFDPAANTTRGMVVSMLYRNVSEPAVSASTIFADVNVDTYYANAVKWAKEQGIVNGTSESKFEPDSSVTREQLVSILYRLAGSPTVGNVDMSKFYDAGKVSAYATSAFAWAIQNGIIKGNANGSLNPVSNASRAEVATMLMNYFNVVK